ncbi:hypothetical protein HMPREF9436_01739 [Faecalibacterium cf. prausnitzii KLE1255]|uniref:Uncharacterized protein n=1 Tax=Faecalibacterium cf. prausnitzii KLE1255 TaxID=748224 RepID=E2ZJ92_9FIRM|nr:hypothetical protein HMPREF9436_01739 [Faecalibacterium cf. prausnitzii KLE1255]
MPPSWWYPAFVRFLPVSGEKLFESCTTTKQKIPRRMSEDFCGGELGTRTPAPLRGQQRAACAGEISIQFHTASQLRYSAGS